MVIKKAEMAQRISYEMYEFESNEDLMEFVAVIEKHNEYGVFYLPVTFPTEDAHLCIVLGTVEGICKLEKDAKVTGVMAEMLDDVFG